MVEEPWRRPYPLSERHYQLERRVGDGIADAIRAAMERSVAAMLESPDNELNEAAVRSDMVVHMLSAAIGVSVDIEGETKTREMLGDLAPSTPQAMLKGEAWSDTLGERLRHERRRLQAARKASRRS